MRLWKPFRCVTCCVLACLAAVACAERPNEGKDVRKEDASAPGELLMHFRRRNPEREVLKWAEADLNNDGRQDCIVIYRVSKEKNMMRVVLDLDGRYLETNEVPAPHSDQMIRFRDIDNKPPMEFIVQGSKGSKMGFAVFRIEENRLVDLFGEGMEDCC